MLVVTYHLHHHHHHPKHLQCAYYMLDIGAFHESHTKNQNVSVR